METNNNPKKSEPSLDQSSNILKVNFGIFLFYSIFFPVVDPSDGLMMSATFAYGHAAILFFVGIIFLFSDKTRGSGAGMILASFLLAGVGFSFCLGGLNFH